MSPPRDGCRARDQPSGQAEQHDLAGRHMPAREAAADVLGMFSLGFALVVCFSIGLALTMVSAGVVAALSVKHVGLECRQSMRPRGPGVRG
jgi:hypothetical protein